MDDYGYARTCFEYDLESGILTRVKKFSRWGTLSDCKPKNDWCTNEHGYYRLKFNGRYTKVHRVVWLWMTKSWPGEIDHIDGNRTNNRWSNLREVSRKDNGRNLRPRKDSLTGVPGVVWEYNAWCCKIKFEYQSIYLGRTKDFFEACCIRKSAENKYNFHPNHGRD